MHYCINVNLVSILNELKNVKTMKEFFQKRNIDINSKEIHELTNFRRQSQGKLINFKFSHQNYTEYNNNFNQNNEFNNFIPFFQIYNKKFYVLSYKYITIIFIILLKK